MGPRAPSCPLVKAILTKQRDTAVFPAKGTQQMELSVFFFLITLSPIKQAELSFVISEPNLAAVHEMYHPNGRLFDKCQHKQCCMQARLQTDSDGCVNRDGRIFNKMNSWADPSSYRARRCLGFFTNGTFRVLHNPLQWWTIVTNLQCYYLNWQLLQI